MTYVLAAHLHSLAAELVLDTYGRNNEVHSMLRIVVMGVVIGSADRIFADKYRIYRF